MLCSQIVYQRIFASSGGHVLKIKFIGAALTVTGSRTEIKYNGSRYLIDCGLFQGPREIREQNWSIVENADKIKAIILTHAHIDHSGYIPSIVNQGFRGKIFCSEATADLCRILLPDSGYLQEEDAYFANMKKYSSHSPALPLYTEKDAIASLEYFSPMPLNEWVELEPGLSFKLSRSSHILGATFVQLSYKSNHGSKIVTFSGDLGHARSLVLKEPVQITESDSLILESTYGDRVQPKVDVMTQFKNIIHKVLERGGTLVIPAFAVGRSQELLHLIHRLEESGEIKKYPVYLDSPMALDATELYLKYGDELRPEVIKNRTVSPMKCARFTPVRTRDDSMLLCMSTEPKIVISAAGMLTGGRIMHHLKSKLPDSKSAVLFVGHQVEGTKGYLLKNGLGKIRIHHQDVDVEAEILALDSLSAHADSNELVQWVSGFSKKPKKIFLNHGEKNSIEALQYRLKHELGLESVIPKPGDEFQLD
jgi:metallo-beta-lactamase family protein